MKFLLNKSTYIFLKNLQENSASSRIHPACFCILLERNFPINRNQNPVFKTLTHIRSCIMAALKLHTSNTLDIYSALSDTALELPMVSEGISAGFPSPAMDFTDLSIDLNKHLIKHPSSTFYGRVKGESMKDEGIHDGDLLVIDKSIRPADGKIAVCYLDGEFTIKRIRIDKDICWLMPANDKYTPIKVTSDNDFLIWGIVTHVIKTF